MLPLLVPSIGSNDVDAVLVKIRDRSVDEYVRWSLVSGLTLLYDAGRRSKVEVEQWLEALLREAIVTADGKLALAVASEIQHINATGLLDLVGQAFDADLIPLDFFGPKADYYEGFAKHPSTRREWTVSDTATELESWFSVENADSPVGLVGPHERELDEPFDPELLSFREPGGTVRYDQRHVGRNEACPCGSGKKYKKCCGRAGALPDL